MKKIRILSLTLIVAAMLMGAGYAAWTDTLTVNNTIKTGDLDVKFVQDNLSLMYPYAFGDQYVSANATIDDATAHTMTVTLSNLYPGCCAYFRLKGVNTGTIPAKFDSINVTFSGDTDLLKYLSYKTNIAIDQDGEIQNVHYFNNLNGKLENFATTFNNCMQGMQLEPNNKGCFYIGIPNNSSGNILNNTNTINTNSINTDGYIVINFDKSATNDSQLKTLTFTFTINFKQFNL